MRAPSWSRGLRMQGAAIRLETQSNAHSRRIYVGDCFVPGFFWHKTSAGINVALAVLVKRHYIKKPDADISLTILSAKLDAKTEFVTLASPDAEVLASIMNALCLVLMSYITMEYPC